MTTCRMKLVSGRWQYAVNGRAVSEQVYRAACAREQREMARVLEKQRGRRFAMPGLFGDRRDWRLENGGKGRYCHQLGDRPKDPKAYCNSFGEMMEKAKRKHFAVDTNN